MVQCYACGNFLPKHSEWCQPRECEACGRVYRGYSGTSNCVFCNDPKNKRRLQNTKGRFVALLNKKGESNLDQETGLVI